MPRGRRILRRLGCGLGLLAVLIGGGLIAGVGFFLLPPGQNIIRQEVERAVQGLVVGGSFRIGGLSTDLVSTVRLTDVTLTDIDGREVLSVQDLSAELDFWDLLGGTVHLSEVRADGVRGNLRIADDGTVDVVRLFGGYEPADPGAPPWEGLPLPVRVDRFDLRDLGVEVVGGGLDIAVTETNLSGSFSGSGQRLALEGVSLAGAVVRPKPGPVHLGLNLVLDGGAVEHLDVEARVWGSAVSAQGAWTDPGETAENLTLDARVGALDLADVDVFANAGLAGRWSGAVTARGRLADLAVQVGLNGIEGTPGRLDLRGQIDAARPAWSGDLTATGVRLEAILPGVPGPFPIDGSVAFEGEGSAWPDGVRTDLRFPNVHTEILGIRLDEVAGGAALRNGVLVLDQVRAVGPAGRVLVGGDVNLLTSTADLQVTGTVLDTAALAGVSVPVELAGSQARVSARVIVPWSSPQTDVRVDGVLEGGRVRWTEELTFDDVRGPFSVQVQGADVDVRGSWIGRGGVAYGSEIGRVQATGVEVQVRASGTTVRGEVVANDLAYAVLSGAAAAELGEGLAFSTLAGRFSVDVPVDGPLVVQTDLAVGPHQLLKFPGEIGVIRLGLVGDRLDVAAALDAGPLRRLLDAELGLDLGALRFDLPRLSVSPVDGQVWTARDGVAFSVTERGEIRGLRADLRSTWGRLRANGDVGATGPQDLTLTVDDLHIDQVARLVPGWLGGAAGEVGGVVTLGGDAEDLRLGADIEAIELDYRTDDLGEVVRGAQARLVASGQGQSLVVTGSVTRDGELLASADAAIPFSLAFSALTPLPEQELRADLWVSPGEMSRFSEVFPVVSPLVGTASARASVRGTLRRPTLEAAGVAEIPVDGLRDPLRLEARITRDGSGVSWRAALREGLALRADLRGGGSTRLDEITDWLVAGGASPDWQASDLLLGDLRGGLALKGVPLRGLAEWGGVPADIQGTVWGRVDVAGTLMEPIPSVNLTLERGRIGALEITKPTFLVTTTSSGMDVAFQADLEEPTLETSDRARGATAAAGGSLYLAGKIPIHIDFRKEVAEWSADPIHLDVDLDVPIRAFAAFDSGIIDSEGAILVDGAVDGTLWRPEIHLDTTATPGATFGYRPLGVRARDLELTASVDPTGISLTQLFFRTDAINDGLTDLGGDLLGGIDAVARRGLGRRRDEESAASGRGSIRVSGRAALDEWSVGDLDLKAELDRALLLNQGDQLLRLSTARPLTVSGDLALPSIAGAARVDNATFFLDYATAIGGGSARVDPRIVIHRGGESGTSALAEAWFVDDIAVDVGIDLGRSASGRLTMPVESLAWLGELAVTLTRMDLRARLGGTVRYRQVPCRSRGPDGTLVRARIGGCGLLDPQVEGVVSILDGTARVLNADFELEDSEVSFVGNEVYNPNLDLHGTMTAAGGEAIDMDIGGTAYNPDITFSSADTDQIFTTLLLGRADAGTQGLSQALAMVGVQSLLSGLNVGSINVDPSGSVVWGMTVARNVFAEVTLGGTPRPDRNVAELEVELTVAEGLLARLGFGAYAIPFWADLLLERKFDHPRVGETRSRADEP